MTLRKFAPTWEKLTQLPRRNLLMGGGALIALAGIVTIGIARAADDSTTSRLGGVEVRQDRSSYTITVPDAQESQARLNGRALQVRSWDNAVGLQSEQNIALPDADLTREPQVSRKNGNLVVTVSKQDPAAAAPRQKSWDTQPIAPFGHDLFARMEQMEREMDAMFSGAFGDMSRLGSLPGRSAIPAAPRALFGNMGLDLQDKGKDYIIRAQNLDPAKQNINVSVDNERILKITARQDNAGAGRQASSHITQAFTLPGPVKSSEMKVDQRDGGLVITLPKA